MTCNLSDLKLFLFSEFFDFYSNYGDLLLFTHVILIIFVPYVAGHFAAPWYFRNRKAAMALAVISSGSTSLLCFLFFDTYIPVPEDLQSEIVTAMYVVSIVLGLIIWKFSYSFGHDDAKGDKEEVEEISKHVIEKHVSSAMQSVANKIISDVSVKLDSLKENFTGVTNIVKQEHSSTRGRIYQWNEHLLTIIKTLSNRIDAHLEQSNDDSVANDNNNTTSKNTTNQNKQEKGKEARQTGEDIQHYVYAKLSMERKPREKIQFSLEQGEPDIVITKNDTPTQVIAVKSYSLDITTKQGMRNTKGQKVAVTFQASKDAKAEVDFAREHEMDTIRLIVINISTGRMIYNNMVGFDQKITLRDYLESDDDYDGA